MVATVKDKLQDYLNPNFTLTDFVNGSTDHIRQVQFLYMTDATEVADGEPATSKETSQVEGSLKNSLHCLGGKKECIKKFSLQVLQNN